VSEETYLAKALGPLSALLDDPSVIEIAVNPDGTVWTERSGDAWMRSTGITLAQPDARLLASQLAGPKSLGAKTPLVTSSRPRGKDVWRVQIVGQPVTPAGYAVSLRRDVLREVSLDAFEYIRRTDGAAPLQQGTTSPEDHLVEGRVSEFFEAAIAARWNILVSGGTSSGKTSFMRALLKQIPEKERIVTIEDSREIRSPHPNVVNLIAGDNEASGSLKLLDATLRMRPDRILLGEIRGVEAWSYLEAINTGHDGSISTIHGNSPAAALERLAFLVMRAGLGLLRTEIVDYARSIIDCVVQLERKDGRRCISQIEICDSARWKKIEVAQMNGGNAP
jgi:type IV secretion system protein VirB11